MTRRRTPASTGDSFDVDEALAAMNAGEFRALLPPIGEGDIYLGQHEMLDEVLSIDVAACAAMYVVAMYMSADPTQRASPFGRQSTTSAESRTSGSRFVRWSAPRWSRFRRNRTAYWSVARWK